MTSITEPSCQRGFAASGWPVDVTRNGSVQFRRAIQPDAAAIAELHVAAWRETYVGLLPDEMLAGLSVDERATMWSRILCDVEAQDAAIFLAEEKDRAVAFASCARQGDEALIQAGFNGEIGAIYVLRSHQKRGIGRRLMAAVAEALGESGCRSASLWVLSENAQARRFYGALGGEIVGERREIQAGVELIELAYGWRDLSGLKG